MTNPAENRPKAPFSGAYCKFVRGYLYAAATLVPLTLFALIVLVLFQTVTLDFGGQTGRIVETWINGLYMGATPQHRTGNDVEIILFLAIALLVCCVAFGILFGQIKDGFNLNRDGTPVKQASKRRKIIFAVSVTLGPLGFDRFLMRRYACGAVKLLLCLVSVLFVWMQIDGVTLNFLPVVIRAYLYIFTFLAWTVDIVLIHCGMAKEKGKDGKRYLQ